MVQFYSLWIKVYACVNADCNMTLKLASSMIISKCGHLHMLQSTFSNSLNRRFWNLTSWLLPVPCLGWHTQSWCGSFQHTDHWAAKGLSGLLLCQGYLSVFSQLRTWSQSSSAQMTTALQSLNHHQPWCNTEQRLMNSRDRAWANQIQSRVVAFKVSLTWMAHSFRSTALLPRDNW